MTSLPLPPFRRAFDAARDPLTARNALGILNGGGGSGAPTNAEYITSSADATLTNERVLTDSVTITWDFSTPGQAKANTSAGGGNVSNSGTPTSGQYAKWVTATTIEGVAPATVLSDIGAQPAGNYQPLDADLTSLAGASSINTIYYRSAADTWGPITIGTGLSFSGGTLANTLSIAGLAPLASPVFTGDPQAPTPATGDNDTSIATTAFVKAQGYLTTVSAAASYQPLDPTLTALAAFNSNGLLTQTAADTFTGRTLTAPAAGITVSNGNGVAGNPTLALANDLAALEGLGGTNTIYYRSGTDAWSAVTVGSGLSFSGGTLTATGSGFPTTAWNTYTPTIAAGSGSLTSASATGRYIQAGKVVFFTARITITTNGTGQSYITAALPVAAFAATQALAGYHETRTEALSAAILSSAPGVARIKNSAGEYPGENGAVLVISGSYEAA